MRKPTALVLFGVFYFTGTFLLAYFAPVTHDEFYTLYVASLPLAQMWQALLASVDFHPPLSFLLTRPCLLVLGENPVALRLVPIVSGFFFLLAIYSLLVRRFSSTVAWVGALIPLTTLVGNFSFNARSYMLMLALVGWAAYFWTKAGKKNTTIVSLFLFLAAITHYYAVLAFFPFFLSELVYWLRTKEFRFYRFLSPTIAGLLALPILLPLVSNAKRYSNTYNMHASLASFFETYDFLIGQRAWFLWGAVLLVLLVMKRKYFFRRVRELEVSPWEKAMVLSLVAVPLLGVTLSIISHAGFTYRYVLIGILGLSVLAAYLVHAYVPRAGAVLALMLVWIVLCWTKNFRWMSQQRDLILRDARALLQAAGTEPVLIGHYDLFMQYSLYEKSPRFEFLNNESAVSKFIEGKDCRYQNEALLFYGNRTVSPRKVLERGNSFPCVLPQYPTDIEGLLEAKRGEKLSWEVGEFTLYRCEASGRVLDGRGGQGAT